MIEYIRTDNPSIRIYYTVREDNGGFEAVAKEIQSSSGTFLDEWLDPQVEIKELIQVDAFFDGIRHMQFLDKGYVNYPDMSEITKILNVFAALERKYCRKND